MKGIFFILVRSFVGSVPLYLFVLNSFFGVLYAHGDQTNASFAANSNGINDSGRYSSELPGGPYFSIIVDFHPPNTNVNGSPFPASVKTSDGRTNFESIPAIFFMATNSFCGPVKLHDGNGNEVLLLRPDVNSPAAYPAFYNVREMSILLTPVFNHNGWPFPRPLYGPSVEMTFELEKYFKMEKPGLYQLTVWPKIYKKTSSTNETCVCLDLPPVTIPVQWQPRRPYFNMQQGH